jgi:hypothetical protein
MKYVSMRMPEPGPFGEIFFEAKVLAMVLALLVNNLAGGWVESVVTFATHRVFFFTVMRPQDSRIDRAPTPGVARSEHCPHKWDDHNHIQFRFRLHRHSGTVRYSTCHLNPPDTGTRDVRTSSQHC